MFNTEDKKEYEMQDIPGCRDNEMENSSRKGSFVTYFTVMNEQPLISYSRVGKVAEKLNGELYSAGKKISDKSSSFVDSEGSETMHECQNPAETEPMFGPVMPKLPLLEMNEIGEVLFKERGPDSLHSSESVL